MGGGGGNADFCLSTKILMYHPLLRLTFLFRAPLCIWLVVLLLSSALLFVSAQTLDSRTLGKCFYSFLLLVFHLPPPHPLSSLSLNYHGSGFELSLLFFLGMNWCQTRPCYNARLLLFFSFRFLLCLNSRITLPQPRTWLGFYNLVGDLG